MRIIFVPLSLALTFVAAAPARAAAQTTGQPRFHVTGGYQRLQSDEQAFPVGANVDLARTWGRWGLVGELGWAWDRDQSLLGVIDFTWRAWNVGVGPRWEENLGSHVRVYGQLLGGILHTRFSAAFPQPDTRLPAFGPPDALRAVDRTSTNTAFIAQPGIGVNVMVARGWGAVGQVDYRRSFIDDADDPQPTFDGAENGENQMRLVVALRRTF